MAPNDDTVRRNFLLPIAQADWLREHAFRMRRPQAAIVREALTEYRARAETAVSVAGHDRNRADRALQRRLGHRPRCPSRREWRDVGPRRLMWDTDAPLLADKSAWARVGHYANVWLEALDADRIVSCAVSHLELLYGARTRTDVEQLDADLAHLRDVTITRGTLAAAKRGILELVAARGSDGHHRVPPQDAIIAACAAEHGCAVLHHDAHYDRLADVLAFESVWSAPRGTI